jgi:hypothetical protein
MLKFMRAGLTAAAFQLGAAVGIALLFSLLASPDISNEANLTTGKTAAAFWTAASPFLTWAYLLVAAGLAFTNYRVVYKTAAHLRQALRIMHFAQPVQALNVLAVQFGLAAILFAAFALRGPPDFLAEIIGWFGLSYAAPIIWSASVSIAVAAFGANAYAAVLASQSADFHA